MVTGILNEHPRSAIARRTTEDKDKFAEFYEEMLEALSIQDGSQVDVLLDHPNRQIIIRPTDPLVIAGVDADFARQVSDFITAYRPALEELAK